jgi:RHS repeat-associated protein
VTTFELPAGGSGSVWVPSSSEGPNGTSTTLYKFKVESGVIEPTEELAPVPAGVSCGKEISELKEGCRALKFRYATETKAKGEKASEWGEVAGHLAEVKYIAWNASKTKTETAVAEYAYDAKGRLRAEWDPRVTPSPLKTTYGYDTEGHVTAVSAPGHEPWLLEQGTIPSDASTGRVLAMAVPSAGTALGTGEAPENSEVPTLSSTKPVVGTAISVNLTSEKTPGKWNKNPQAFIYQWEDCSSTGKECTPISGAVNQTYYPVAGDEGHTLVAQALALNATASVVASSVATSTVASGTPKTPLPEPPSVGSDSVWTLEYQVPVSGSGAPNEMSSTETAKWGQTDDPSEAMAIFPPDKVMGWPAKKYERETVYYLDGRDRAVNIAIPTGGISTTEYNLYNDVVRTLSPDNRAAALKEGCKSETECKSAEMSKLLDTEFSYEEKGSEPGTEMLSTLGPQHTVKLAVGKEGKTYEEVLAREHTSYVYNEGAPSEGGPYHLVTETIEDAETAGKEEFDKRTTKTSYSGQSNLGWKLRKPTSVTTNPTGLNLMHTTEYNSTTGEVTETMTPAASGKDASVPPAYLSEFGKVGSEPGQLKEPRATALAPNGNIYVLDTGNARVEEFTPSGSYVATFGASGKGNGQLSSPFGFAVDSKGNIWVADTGNDRVEEFNSKHEYVSQFGSEGTAGGQFKEPKAIAVTASGTIFVVDAANNRIEKFNEKGEFTSTFGFGVSNGEAKLQVCTSSCRAGIAGTGNGQLSETRGVAVSSTGHVWVADAGNSRIQEFGESGEFLAKVGSNGTGNGQFEEPKGIAIDSAGNLWVADAKADRLQKFTSTGVFVSAAGAKGGGTGQFETAWGLAITSAGEIYIADVYNYRVDHWGPTVTGNEGAHDTKAIYYTAAANSEYKECGEHPAMANLPCETTPAAQPGTSGLPELPTTKYTYNVWGEPETTIETVGSTARTKTNTYDGAGRLKTAAISSTVGTALPTVTDEYNKETGALEKQSTTAESKTKTVTSVYNKLGELESYIDAGENTATYEYDVDGRVKKVNTGKGTETFTYSETTGLITELVYENGTTKLPFTGTYDVEGYMLTEGYPNGMTAAYTYNQVGKPTALEYKKTTHCTEKCVWFSDSVIPSIHGQWLEQTSTLSHQAYSYDNAGRLTQAQNTPTGKDCTTRIYAYDEDTNRTSLTTRESSTEKCATEGGTIQEHTYDTADRLTDPGIAYNTFGDITTLPANDAEASAEHELTNTYYTDNQVASQKQNKQTIGYNLDPAGRTLETISTGEPINSTITSHYAGPSNTPAWTLNPISNEWRRNITDINGNLVAIQNNGETPVLQLTNLHGDIIATAYLSETATELASEADTGEFGVPAVSAPAKYAWLGAIELPTELPSGVITMGARSYVPQIGRFLQPDPVLGGSANAYSYTFGDPVNSTDPTGTYTNTASAATLIAMELEGQGIAAGAIGQRHKEEEEEQREADERYAAEQAARAAAEAAAEAAVAGPQYAGEEEYWEEWEEEEGEYEYVSNRHGGESSTEEHHIESGVLYQPLSWEGAGKGAVRATTPLCEAVAEGPCARLVPDDHSPNVQSACNRTGQHCPGRRGSGRRVPGGSGSPWEPADALCITVGWTNPVTGYICGAYGAIRVATK